MPSDRSRQALLDIRDNIRLAQSFVSGLDERAFAGDRRTYYAVVRCLEIVSEASRRLDDAMKARHPTQPWEQIAAAGNVYRHRYDNLDEAFVWRTVVDALPGLRAAVEAELGETDSAS